MVTRAVALLQARRRGGEPRLQVTTTQLVAVTCWLVVTTDVDELRVFVLLGLVDPVLVPQMPRSARRMSRIATC
jgi:hypothetical protein